MAEKTVLWTVVAVIAVLLVWGIVGGIEAQDSGVTCNTGLGNTLCWDWEQNFAGDVEEFFDDSDDDDSEG